MNTENPERQPPGGQPFAVKDCALATLATGRKARLLQSLRTELAQVESASIYHHFWGGLLEPRFEVREYNNDFAAWARHGLHDPVLAERLALLDPNRYADLEALRQDLLDLIDARLDEAEHLMWAPASEQFELLRSQIVVFDTGARLDAPEGLPAAVRLLSPGSLFYHFVDARRRNPDGGDDFSDWLTIFGERHAPLREGLADVDPFFGSLRDLQARLTALFDDYFQPEANR